SYFQKGEEVSQRDLEANGINSHSDLVFLTTDGYIGFTKDYQKVALATEDILLYHPNFYDILLALKKDQTKVISNSVDGIEEIKKITQNLIKNKNREEKIKTIYEYILSRVSYTENIDLQDRKIFSGIETFQNRDGVCEGYTALFYYMLQFAGIYDSKVIYGDVIDSQDFPNIGHAWVQIGENYYDPTFDDPIGQVDTKKFHEYKYYNLPRDIFYTNRYETGNTPETLKSTSLQYRKNLIQQNLSKLIDKYDNTDYRLLIPLKFKQQYGYSYNEEITINNYSKIAPIYEVLDYHYNTESGKLFTIKKLNYFPVDTQNNNIENILSQIDYDVTGYTMFAWKMPDGSYEYRLAYNVEYY
ncbi:hypothetical protein MK079_02150, partial [Candidatus Gracilibacteria bacterium]|nr:hypothetical protein [Candidatus Gracilibacteria bacterium]